MFKPWLIRTLDIRYVYLMREGKTRKHKIGIATNPQWRREDIAENLSQELRIIMARRVVGARRIEKKMHNIFHGDRFIYHRSGSGKTEWFYFGMLDRWSAQLWLDWFYLCSFLRMIWFFVTLATSLYLLLKIYFY